MRKVAMILALLCALPVLFPAAHATDCVTDVDSGTVCTDIPVAKPGTPDGAPGVPAAASPYFGRYYLYIGAGDCTESATAAISNACRGTPASPGSGVPLPSPPGPVGAGALGILYQESNSFDGLQRRQFAFGSGLRPADHMILI